MVAAVRALVGPPAQGLVRRLGRPRPAPGALAGRGGGPGGAHPGAQPEVAGGDAAPRLQGGLRDGGDRRLPVRLRRHRRGGRGLDVRAGDRGLRRRPGACASSSRESNPWALRAIAERLLEAAERGLWDAVARGARDAALGVLEGEGWRRTGERRRPVYPMSALVGLDDLVTRARARRAIDPAIGGVLLRGRQGVGQDDRRPGAGRAAARRARRSSSSRSARPRTGSSARSTSRAAPGRGASTGSSRACCAAAHGGVLYVDEVNLLADHLVDVLLDAAATGVNRVERDGISHAHASRFVLVGSMNPEEGELRPQLLDRFGLSVRVSTPRPIPSDRAEAVRRRLAFDADPDAFRGRMGGRRGATWPRGCARPRPAPLADGPRSSAWPSCASAPAPRGCAADLVICRAAAALAGWRATRPAGEDEVRRVAPLALGHRRRTPWHESTARDGDLDEVLEETRDGPSDRAPAAAEADEPPTPTRGKPDHVPGGKGAEPPLPPADPAEVPERTLGALLDPVGAAPTAGGGPSGRRGGDDGSSEHGRLVGAERAAPGPVMGPLAAVATVSAAAARRVGTDVPAGTPLEVSEADLHLAVRRAPVANLVVLAVDSSGSMGAEGRLATARQTVLSLLVDAYQRRDRVALVSFGGESAEVVLRPTGSTEVARARLAAMTTGGRTPLAAGIEAALALGRGYQAGSLRPLLVVLSDGRATWAPGGEDPVIASRRAASAVATARIPAVVVDCEQGGTRLGLARPLAEAMGARYIAPEELAAALASWLTP